MSSLWFYIFGTHDNNENNVHPQHEIVHISDPILCEFPLQQEPSKCDENVDKSDTENNKIITKCDPKVAKLYNQEQILIDLFGKQFFEAICIEKFDGPKHIEQEYRADSLKKIIMEKNKEEKNNEESDQNFTQNINPISDISKKKNKKKKWYKKN